MNRLTWFMSGKEYSEMKKKKESEIKIKKKKTQKKKNPQTTVNMAVLAMLALVIVSWIGLLRYHDDTPEKYKECIERAEEFEKNEQYKYAIEQYKEALKLDKSEKKVYWQLVQDYKVLEQMDNAIEQCKYVIKNFEDNYDAYIEVIRYYVENNQYENALRNIMEARQQYKDDTELEQLWLDCRGTYSQTGMSYAQVSEIWDGQIKVQSWDGLCGIVDVGNSGYKLGAEYEECSLFTQVTEEEKLAVVHTEDDVYLLDKNGYRCVVAAQELDSIGMFSEGVSVVSKDGKYGYCKLDEEKMVLTEESKLEYDAATVMYQGLAAVKKGDDWAIIDKELKEITGYDFEEVVVNEFNICSCQGVIFVKKKNSDKYSLINGEGKYICEDAFEQAKPFLQEGNGAVCKDGKWGFVDADGKEKTEFVFDDAGSMINGYAPVCINDKWGYINEDKDIYISCEFQEAKSFDDKGNAPVKIENQWMLLHMYLYDATEEE